MIIESKMSPGDNAYILYDSKIIKAEVTGLTIEIISGKQTETYSLMFKDSRGNIQRLDMESNCIFKSADDLIMELLSDLDEK